MGKKTKECYRRAFLYKIINALMVWGTRLCVVCAIGYGYFIYQGKALWSDMFPLMAVFFGVIFIHYMTLFHYLHFHPFVIGMLRNKTLGEMNPEIFEEFLFRYWFVYPAEIEDCSVILKDVKKSSPNLRFCFDKDIKTDSFLTGKIREIKLDERDDYFTVNIDLV